MEAVATDITTYLAQQERKKRDRTGSRAIRNYYQLNPQKGQK